MEIHVPNLFKLKDFLTLGAIRHGEPKVELTITGTGQASVPPDSLASSPEVQRQVEIMKRLAIAIPAVEK
jgi:hypothetical protein